ncbi:MAG: MGMT family protein [Bacteroidia bacterium]|jgi:methylated-DNA-protein-cysteine methyltransferase-like protein
MSKEKYDFYERVFDVVRLVPHGRVTTYGAIAKFLGASKSSRLVGWAMNRSHGLIPTVPAHRVVNRVGLLSGKAHFSNPTEMQRLLESEGIQVKDDQIINFYDVFWDPALMDL